jgi:hypothetical protein
MSSGSDNTPKPDDIHTGLERLREISAELDALQKTAEQDNLRIAHLNREAEIVQRMLDRLRRGWRPQF